MVWIIRVLIIGTFSISGERIFTGYSRTTVNNGAPYPASPKLLK
jgi:hypothetical protein